MSGVLIAIHIREVFHALAAGGCVMTNIIDTILMYLINNIVGSGKP